MKYLPFDLCQLFEIFQVLIDRMVHLCEIQNLVFVYVLMDCMQLTGPPGTRLASTAKGGSLPGRTEKRHMKPVLAKIKRFLNFHEVTIKEELFWSPSSIDNSAAERPPLLRSNTLLLAERRYVG